MLGSFTGLQGNKTDMGEQLLNAAASQSIRHLFSRSESVEVTIRCYPSSKLLQGSVDSFQMQGKGLLIRKDFWVENMVFETDAVAIDVAAALRGQIKLKQPTQAVAQVTLTEDGINKAFESPLVKQRLENLTLPALTNLSGGEPVSFREVQVTLLPQNQVKLLAKTDLPNCQDVQIALLSTLAIDRRRRILFQNPQFLGEDVPEAVRGLSQILTEAFSEILNEMVDLDRFDLDGILLRMNRLETAGKFLHFSGYAQIDHFPRIP